MIRKILAPIDLSPITEAVVGWATSLARDMNASLILLHVQEPVVENMGGEIYYPMPVTESVELRRAIQAIKPTDKSVVYEHRLEAGNAATEIVRVANEENVELIVMGTHGRSGLLRLLMGSVAEAVLRHASCPMLVVKQPGTKHIPPDDQSAADAIE